MCGRVIPAAIIVGHTVGCGDVRYGTEDLGVQAHQFYADAETRGGKPNILYVYPASEYERLKSYVTSAFASDFRSVESRSYDSKQFDVRTETISYQRKTRHKKQCNATVEKRYYRIAFTTLTVDCEVMSYWTRWNKPPTHSPFEFLAWRDDWYWDKQATLVESIKLQEHIRERMGYDFESVGHMDSLVLDGKFVDDQVIAEATLNPTPPWCSKGKRDEQPTNC